MNTTPDTQSDARPPAEGNQGEGNRDAARRFDQAEKSFVESERGKRQIKRAGEVTPQEAEVLEGAEQIGQSHSKGEDGNAGAGTNTNTGCEASKQAKR